MLDACDNCDYTDNEDQADNDSDGMGDVCDSDRDGDGIANESDACPDTASSSAYQESGTDTNTWDGCGFDTDGDGIYDHKECASCVNTVNSALSATCGLTDGDGDGYPNTCDNCPDNSNSSQVDMDGDGQGNTCDDDIDGDGLANFGDLCAKSTADSWSISIISVTVNTTPGVVCVTDSDQYGRPTVWYLNGVASEEICGTKVSYTTQELIDNVDALRIVYGILTLGAIDPSQRHINKTWDDIIDFTKADNYDADLDSCAFLGTDLGYDKTVCGTAQKDTDSDGIGDACDRRPTIPNVPNSKEPDANPFGFGL